MVSSADGRFLYASVRSKPFSVYTYAIDPKTGALNWKAASPLPDSMVHINLDKTGRWLLSASYGGGTMGVNAVDAQGRIASDPTRFFQSGGVKPHSVRVDQANKFVYVPHLGTDEIRTYAFDAATGQLGGPSGGEASVSTKLPKDFGPRHFVFSNDGRFLYLLGEMSGNVVVYERAADTGALKQIQSISSMPSDSPLSPGVPRLPAGTPGALDFDETKVIWCADIQMTSSGRFLYTSERTRSNLSRFAVDQATGKLTLLGQTPTEKQPRGFAIDPQGNYMIVSGEKSNTISLYSLDPTTGDLTLKQKAPVGNGANWVQIVQTKE
jgi:6-phosphogluconolactonase